MSDRSKILVTLQFICMIFLLTQQKLMATGIFLAFQFLGIVLSLWSIYIMKFGHFNIQPELKKNAVLVTSGPYKIIRNPMYTGIILFFGAGMASSFHILNLLVFLLLILVFLFKIKSEEKFMIIRFSNDYIAYQKRTYRIIPYLF